MATSMNAISNKITSGDLTITAGNLLLPATTTSVGTIKVNNVVYFNCIIDNVIIGKSAGNLTMSGGGNVFLGDSCATNVTSGSNNTVIGAGSGTAITGGAWNVILGADSGTGISTSSNNTIAGYGCLANGCDGSANLILGSWDGATPGEASGSAYTGAEHSNILLMNKGVVGESHVCRIGTQGTGVGQQNKAFVVGIYNTAVGATANVALVDSDGQIGGLAGSTGQILQGGTKPSFTTATYPATSAQGDLLICTSSNAISAIAKNTSATRYLSNTGTSNNPAWAQVDLTNGVTGILPAGNGGGLAWSNNTASAPTVVVNSGYVSSYTSGVATYTVPASVAILQRIAITGSIAGGGTNYWVLQMNTGQTLYSGSSSTSSGGTVTATSAHDCIEIQCVVANTTFSVLRSEGTLTLA